jgi:RHS repeat-associated protein
VAAKDGGGATVFTAAYDARTRRTAKTEGASTTTYRYDGGTNFQELQNGAVVTELVRAGGLGGGIGSVLYSDKSMAPAAPGPVEHFVYNAVGHTVALTDAAGTVTQASLYEAFGDTVVKTGPSTNNRPANTKERDASIGLDNHGFRYYDADSGRYVTRDPIGYGDGLNVYAHVHNDPVNGFDPLGLVEPGGRGTGRLKRAWWAPDGFRTLRSVGKGMADISIQFHALPEELLPLVKGWVERYQLRVAGMRSFPFHVREFTADQLSELFHVDSPYKRLTFTLDKPFLEVANEVAFMKKNPAHLRLDIGKRHEKGLEQAWLSSRTEDRGALSIWNQIAKHLKAVTNKGVTAINARTGASAAMRSFRYTPGAKELEEAGAPMLPPAGTSILKLGLVEGARQPEK